MGVVLLIILCVMIWGVMVALPLWTVVNLVCWVFHISFHLSLLQSLALSLFAGVINTLLFGKKEEN